MTPDKQCEADRDQQQRVLGNLECNDLSGDRGTDVGAHDDADRLRHRHQSGGQP